MQSQQKKVKWSRGETADALEERTDTGITQVSVSKMENIIADIYGNISRRPALKIIDSVAGATDIPVIIGASIADYSFVRPPQSFVFTIDAKTYIIFISDQMGIFGGLLIQNNKFIRRIRITNNTEYTINHTWEDKISTAQYNNFMVVANLYSYDVIFKLTGTDIDTYAISVDTFQFSAPWASPTGTTSQSIGTTEIPGLEFNKNGKGFTGFTYTESSQIAVACKAIDTGLTGSTDTISTYIPIGSIVEFPNLGTYMRVEGFTIGSTNLINPSITYTSLVYENGTIPTTGYCARFQHIPAIHQSIVRTYFNGEEKVDLHRAVTDGNEAIVKSTVSSTGYSYATSSSGAWLDKNTSTLNVLMYGELLTPVAATDIANTKDLYVVVESGYVSLDQYQPTKFTFHNQRLFAGGFYNASLAQKIIPGYAVGSQIARFNDFKNNYNTNSEAVVIDISTEYQEEITYLIDYNGLKIFTNVAEYAYTDQGVVKQSKNGTLSMCQPIIFGSVCLYADKSGGQIRALQYELQTNLFNSSSINQMTQEDLIFNTTTMGGFIDKEHCTGHFLFATQSGYNYTNTYDWTTPIAKHSIAVCNLVPGNQAEIWARWNTPELILPNGYNRHTISNIIEVNNKIWFIVNCYHIYTTSGIKRAAYTLAELDYDNILDFENTAATTDTEYVIIKSTLDNDYYGWTSTHVVYHTVYTTSRNPSVNDTVYSRVGNNFAILGTVTNIINANSFEFVTNDVVTYTTTYDSSKTVIKEQATIPGTISVFDGNEYKWDDTLTQTGAYTKSLSELTNPRVGFMINATLESHPIDVGGKTYTDHKRIGKAVAVIRNTEPNAFTVCDKTGYTSEDKKTVNFYGCTGMKNQVKYTIKNIQGAKFTIESLTMIIEYATLDS